MFSSLLDRIVLAPANALWIAQGLPPDSMAHLHLSKSPDPSVDSHFKLGFAAQVRTSFAFRAHRQNDASVIDRPP